jgi:type II secretory pathway pseudopilin PulG
MLVAARLHPPLSRRPTSAGGAARGRTAAAFTALETLISTVIVGSLIALMLTNLTTGRNSYLVSEATTYTQGEVRRGVDAILRELQNAAQMRRAGDTTGGVDFAGQSAVDFQIGRGVTCGGICWGDETATGRWLHYRLNGNGTPNMQLLRCSTATQTDPIDLSTCRVLANNVQTFSMDYTHSARSVRLRLQVQQGSSQLAGGLVSSGSAPLVAEVQLRNAP